MRKVTRQIKNAFENKKSKKLGNTQTDGTYVWLHNNKIIERRGDGIYWTLAGWNTPTTRERINGILGVGVYQKNYIAMINKQKISSREWIKV